MGRVRQVLHDALRDEWDGLERINRDIRLADFFTVANALMGLFALVLASQGEWRWAVHFVLLGVLLDGVDGAVARLGKGNGPLGATLDTLADAISFCAAPAVLVFSWLPPEGAPWVAAAYALPLAAYFVGGLLRLARFESMRTAKPRQYFSGMPTPAGAMTIVSLVLVGVHQAVVLGVAVYLALLMVSRIRYPKLRSWWAVAALTIIVAVLVAFNNVALQKTITWALLALMAVYVVLGPFYVLARYGPTHREAA